MAEEGDGRAVVRFTPGDEKTGPVIEVDLTPVVSAINTVNEILTTKLDAILEILKNSDRFGVAVKAVESAGTPVQLDDMKIPDGKSLCVQALATNLGDIYWGGSQSEASSKIFPILPGELRTLKVTNAKAVWINADNNNDSVAYGAERK